MKRLAVLLTLLAALAAAAALAARQQVFLPESGAGKHSAGAPGGPPDSEIDRDAARFLGLLDQLTDAHEEITKLRRGLETRQPSEPSSR